MAKGSLARLRGTFWTLSEKSCSTELLLIWFFDPEPQEDDENFDTIRLMRYPLYKGRIVGKHALRIPVLASMIDQ